MEEQRGSNARLAEEYERVRTHYDVLREHELSIIKDYEGKLMREKAICEQRIAEAQGAAAFDRQACAKLETRLRLQEDEIARLR